MQGLISRIKVGVLSAVLVGASITSAAAAPIVFTNEADFNAAVAAAGLTLGLESFETVASGFSPLDVGPFTLTASPTVPFLAMTGAVGLVTHGAKALSVSPGVHPITFTFDTAIRAFSMDVVDGFNTGGGTFSGRIGNGAQQTFFTGGGFGLHDRTFLGILDLDAAFTTLQFAADGGLNSFSLDRVQFDTGGGNPTPVPEPASLTLLAIGLATAGARRLRARRTANAR
jgi:hypothetical protein